MSKVLLNNVSIDTVGEPAKMKGSQKLMIVHAESYGGGSVAFQVREKRSEQYFTDGGWKTIDDGSFTDNAVVKVDFLPVGTEVRATLSGASGANNVRVVIL